MNRVAISLFAIFFALFSCSLFEGCRVKRRLTHTEGVLHERTRENAALTLTVNRQRDAIAALEKHHSEQRAIMKEYAVNSADAAARVRTLERQLHKAARYAKTVHVSRPWPRAVSYALCLRWLEGEARIPRGYSERGSGNPAAAGNNSVASFCARWNTLTPETSLEWLGRLIDQMARMNRQVAYAAKAQKRGMGQ